MKSRRFPRTAAAENRQHRTQSFRNASDPFAEVTGRVAGFAVCVKISMCASEQTGIYPEISFYLRMSAVGTRRAINHGRTS
jgi:hypothetical protein